MYDAQLDLDMTYAQGTGDEYGHYHPIARSGDGFEIGIVAGHTHTVDSEAMSASVLGLVTKTEDTMTDAEKAAQAELEKKVSDGEAATAKAEAATAKANAIIAMSPEHRLYFDKIQTVEAKDAFIAKSAESRDEEIAELVKRSADANPVIYTTAAGIEIRKSDGEVMAAIAKDADATKKRNGELETEREQERLEKRAEDELPHLPAT